MITANAPRWLSITSYSTRARGIIVNYSVIYIITVVSKASASACFFPLFRASSYFYKTKTDVDSYVRVVFPYLVSYANVCSHNTSFSCFFLKTIVDCYGYTLSLSLSTTTILNVPLIFFQAKELEIAVLFFEVLS